MDPYRIRDLLALAVHAARAATVDILDVYASDFTVDIKADHSPLTEADRRSSARIEEMLSASGLPLLSEEGRQVPYAERSLWEWFWLVDPLDGSREFIGRNGDFTVNIALMHRTRPAGGIVYVPVSGELFFAAEGCGAWQAVIKAAKNDQAPCSWDALCGISQRLPLPRGPRPINVVASRSHCNDDTRAAIDALRERYGTIEIRSRGSSLKLCMIAAGTADIYPRCGPTMEWDTAAGQALVEESGGFVRRADSSNEALVYNKTDLTNPYFIASRPQPQGRMP